MAKDPRASHRSVDELFGVYVPSPRADFRIQEVSVEHVLRPDPLPDVDYSFNPYVGCFHSCAFCYSPRLLQLDRSAWGSSVIVKRNAATVLAREVRRMTRGLVMVSTATDPYQFVEGKYRITRHALEVLLRVQWPISVLSRSPLMVRDIDLFTRFDSIEAGMSVPTLDDRARALLEPWAPPIDARLRCLGTLADAGLKTFVSFAPAYPPTGGVTPEAIAGAFAAHGVGEVFTRTLDARWGVRDAILPRLRGTEIGPDLARISDRQYMASFLQAVAEECEARGVRFRSEDRYRNRASEPAEPGDFHFRPSQDSIL
jgi:DNA repair photolyase